VRRHDLLNSLHELLRPRTYLEIGVSSGASMSRSRARSIGVDPAFHVERELLCDLHLVRATSDEFFARAHPLAHFDEPLVDLAFIDGMHLAEYALRDLINTERYTHPASVIVIDYMLPRNVSEADRDRGRPRDDPAWAGDVYKILEPLRTLRPDLVCLEVDTEPTGTVVVMLPDAGSTTLLEAYDDLVEAFVVPDPQDVPGEIISRSRALAPDLLVAAPIWDDLRRLRDIETASARPEVTALLAGAGLGTPR